MAGDARRLRPRPTVQGLRIQAEADVQARHPGVAQLRARTEVRLNVFRSLKNIYAQLIDDDKGVTLVSASTVEKDFTEYGGNADAAKAVGKKIAERAAEKGIKECVFDRGGYIYHGRVASLAEGAREGGLDF